MTDPARTVLVEELLQARFDEHKSYTKTWTDKNTGEHKQVGPFTYVEDESVMDRLDDVLGFGHWGCSAQPAGDNAVLLTLRVRNPKDEMWTEYQDFGYAQNQNSPEPLKEAWTDAFRRVGRLAGIARYVYAGEVTTQGHTPLTPAAVPTGAPATPPPAAPVNQYEGQIDEGDGATCPIHGFAWTLKPAGTSKNGKAYNAFWTCNGKTNGTFCPEKPSKAWQAQQETK